MLLLAQPSERSSLSARILGLQKVAGKVAIELVDDKEERVGEYWLFVESDEVTLYVPDLAPGTYAIKFFHDENNNGEMDYNFLGVPTESFGWSNDAKLKMGLPPIEELLFKVDGLTEITMNARKLF